MVRVRIQFYSIPEQLFKFVRRQRGAEDVSLYSVAAAFSQEVELLLCLHPFRERFDFQLLRHGDECGHDRRVVFIGRQLADKRFVDFQRIDPEPFQIAER